MEKTFICEQRLSEEELSLLKSIPTKVAQFCKKHSGKLVTMITSGGTSVPLEKRSVRFLQNFSTGLRGSLLSQTFLSKGQPVILFYREKSHLPFSHGLTINDIMLDSDPNARLDELKQAVSKFQATRDLLLLLPFTSIYCYLNGLSLLKASMPIPSKLIFCAAVSDFIPKEVSPHKIQTTEQLALQLISSPKILGEMKSQSHLCVSFKLETDQQKLKERVKFAIDTYGVDMVVGNCLQQKKWVQISYNTQVFEKKKESQKFQSQKQTEVQEFIVEKVEAAYQEKFDKNK